MTISYVQGNNPYWYFVDLTGKPAGSGQVFFYDSLNPDNLKTVYQDAAGLLPYSNPINISLNGTVPPIFFKIDSTAPTDLYDIFAYDAQGNLIEQINNYSPGGSGGGSPTIIYGLNNLVINNVMYRNLGTFTVSSTATGLAPGVHQGLTNTLANNFFPDIFYIKNNTSATEIISFPLFSLGTLFPATTDTTPNEYFNLSCTNAGTGETLKCVQFPLTNKVQNLSDQTVSGTIWAKCTSGNNALTMSIVQFFGDGSSASNPAGSGNSVTTEVGSFTLTSGWVQYNFTSQTIPSVASGATGQCGNDGVFLQVGLPLNEATNISFTKPCLYLGANYAINNYIDYDQISAVVDSPRTGDIKISANPLNTSAPWGWVQMNDGTIGDVSSNASSRANIDTFPLFYLIWSLFSSNQTLAPMFTSAGSPVAYGASAVADFSANNQLSLTKQGGRLIASVGRPSSGNNTGTNWGYGQFTGNEQTNQVASHTHTASQANGSVALPNEATSPGTNFGLWGGIGASSNTVFPTSPGAITINSTGVAEVNIQNPVTYQNFYIKL
jgi:hypothetical protein